MSFRFIASMGGAALLLAASLGGQTPNAAKAASKSSAIPRTPDGHPDFQGTWTNATITPVERPSALKDKPTLSDADATAYEKKSAQELNSQDGASDGPLIAAVGSSGTGGYNVLFIDRGSELARVDGQKRTSLVVDPADGRIPPLTDEARKRMQGMMRSFNNYDNVKVRPVSERCLIGFGSTAGPPMMPVLYNNNYQIVQTPDTISILVEMVHDVRNHPHEPETRSVGRAEMAGRFGGALGGRHLVVDTVNFSSGEPLPRGER